MKYHNPSQKPAFTLIEVLIALAILTLIAGLGLFATLRLFQSTSLREEGSLVISLLERARDHSMNNLYALPHGFCFDDASQSYQVFKGAYDTDSAEERSRRGNAVEVTGLAACGSGNEIVFTQLSGTTTPVTMTLSDGGESMTVEVNGEGTIDW